MIWLLLACTTSDGDPDKNKTDSTTEATLSGDTGPPPLPDITATGAKPSLSAEEVAAHLGAAWATPPHPGEVIDTYAYLMSMGDPECPGDPNNITDVWLYGCTSLSGYSYAGVSQLFFERITTQAFAGDLSGVSGDFWIDTATGATLEGGGHAVMVREEGIWIGEMAGSWRWDDGSPWLAHGFSGNIWIEFIDYFAIKLRGAADILGTYVAAQDFVLSAYCDYGPAGKLSLRDPGGGWYTMEFAGCNPCADVYFEGENIGNACVDMSDFVDAMRSRL